MYKEKYYKYKTKYLKLSARGGGSCQCQRPQTQHTQHSVNKDLRIAGLNFGSINDILEYDTDEVPNKKIFKDLMKNFAEWNISNIKRIFYPICQNEYFERDFDYFNYFKEKVGKERDSNNHNQLNFSEIFNNLYHSWRLLMLRLF